MSSVIDLCQKKQYWVLRNTEEVVLIFKFDPLGFVAIFILQVTKILQRLCEENIKQEEIDETIGGEKSFDFRPFHEGNELVERT